MVGQLIKRSLYTLVDHSNQEAVLEKYDKVKDLGVWFDEKLSFREHIQDKINKACKTLGIIKRNFRHLTIPTFVLLYKTGEIPFRLLLFRLGTI